MFKITKRLSVSCFSHFVIQSSKQLLTIYPVAVETFGIYSRRFLSSENVLINQKPFPISSSFLDEERKLNLTSSIFNLLSDEQPVLPLNIFKNSFDLCGIEWYSDPRLANIRTNLQQLRDASVKEDGTTHLSYDEFSKAVCSNESDLKFISQALSKQFVIPDFQRFVGKIKDIYECIKDEKSGQLATYIPQLARQDPNKFGVAGCTVDGQRFALGDASEPFCLQSCIKPLQYAVAISETSTEHIHEYVGKEPSGHNFNAIILDTSGKPHNPMINIGSIVCCSLIKPQEPLADRFEFITNTIKECAAGEHVAFSNSVFQSEKATSYRNMALGYFLKENNCLPADCNIDETVDLYLQLCAITTTCKSGSAMAATLANGGVCPLTPNKRLLSSVAVQNTLSLMHSCGMYEFSGMFAFHVGLPAKSGVAGGLMLIVPNIMGLMIWSPLLDDRGNTVRGTNFCKGLTEAFNFHVYDNLTHCLQKNDPRKLTSPLTDKEELIKNLAFEMFGVQKLFN